MPLFSKRSLADEGREFYALCEQECRSVDRFSASFDAPIGPCVDRAPAKAVRRADADARSAAELLSVLEGLSRSYHEKYVFGMAVRGSARRQGALRVVADLAGSAAARGLEMLMVEQLGSPERFGFIRDTGQFRLAELGQALSDRYPGFAAKALYCAAMKNTDPQRFDRSIQAERRGVLDQADAARQHSRGDAHRLEMIDHYLRMVE